MKKIIYEFSSWFLKNELFKVREIEVEEKPKTYIGRGIRINKSDINVLMGHYGNRMYCLENNPKIYIVAVIEAKKKRIESLENQMLSEKQTLEKWLKEQENLKGETE